MGTLPRLEDCDPGVTAVGFRLIVAMEEQDEKTKGGIILPDSAKDKEALVMVRGRIVSAGSVAFDFADFGDTAPKQGDAIMFGKLAGYMFEGRDGAKYRIMQDKDVSALIEEAA